MRDLVIIPDSLLLAVREQLTVWASSHEKAAEHSIKRDLHLMKAREVRALIRDIDKRRALAGRQPV